MNKEVKLILMVRSRDPRKAIDQLDDFIAEEHSFDFDDFGDGKVDFIDISDQQFATLRQHEIDMAENILAEAMTQNDLNLKGKMLKQAGGLLDSSDLEFEDRTVYEIPGGKGDSYYFVTIRDFWKDE